jgi:UDP-N-acetylmuramoyl-tripeptide--D-alanyl-D-alanine ligase
MKNYLKNLLTKIFVSQAKQIIKKHNPMIIAVVGSVGKTSTKHTIATVLSQKYRVQFQNGNYNVPLTLDFVVTGQSLPPLYNPFGWIKAWLNGQKYIIGNYPYDVLLLEIGTDAPGDIIEFKEIITPDLAVVSAISEEHMEFFKDLEKVAEEELSIAQFSKELIVNIDDINKDFLKLYVPKAVNIIKYGFGHSAIYKINARRNSHHAFNAEIHMPMGKKVAAEIQVAAKHSLKPVAAAVAVADQLGLTTKQIEKGLNNVKPTNGRMRLYEGINNTILIDDTYNSSPLAAEAALNTLYEIQAPQKIAILGSMNELGSVSKVAHQEIGSMCNPNKLDLVITLGEESNKHTAHLAEQNGCKVIRTLDPVKAGKVAAQNLVPGAVVLVKGSQNGVFAEEAIKQLLANPSDINTLVRQNEFWMNKKAQQFGYGEE